MYFLVFIFFVLILVLILFTVGVIPQKCCYDYDSPLNLFMFQEPNIKYSDQLVNLWVDKTWRSDGKRIPCRVESTYVESTPNSERNLILYSHGNAENLLTCSQFIRELSNNVKSDVVAYDYSGYGLNDIDKFERTPEGINLTLLTVFNHLTTELGYQPQKIVFWGYSLGSGPSTHMTSLLCKQKCQPAGLVLFGAYSSILDVVKENTSEDISKWFTERWDNKTMIAEVKCPILILHGQSDGLIKSSHADVLASRNPKAKKVLLPNTGHTKFHWGESVKEVKKWLSENQIFSENQIQ